MIQHTMCIRMDLTCTCILWDYNFLDVSTWRNKLSLIIWTYNSSSPVSERYSTHVTSFFSEGYFLQTRGIYISSHTGLQIPTNNDFPRKLTFLIIFLHLVIDRWRWDKSDPRQQFLFLSSVIKMTKTWLNKWKYAERTESTLWNGIDPYW